MPAPAPTARATLPLTVDRDNEPVTATTAPRVGPVLVPLLSPRPRALTAIGADSARRALGSDVPRLALTRKPSQEEIDALLREQEREQASAWDAHRPVALPVAGGGVSMPFSLFSAGPSKAQRKRDSIVNADYVRRLRRMLAFARERLDSICHADSLAGKPARCRELRAAASRDLQRGIVPDSGRERP